MIMSARALRPRLDSDQRDHFTLRLLIAFDVSGGCPQARMSRQLLYVAKAPSHLAELFAS